MKVKCQHVIKHIQASCGCCIDCPSKITLILFQSDAHMAVHREYESGIIHNWDCGIIKIPIPKLILNQVGSQVSK